LIRAANVADIWALRRRPKRRVFFFNDALLASSYHPYLLALGGMLGPIGASSDQKTLVLRDHGLRGYLQARRRSNKCEVDLQYLTAFARRGRARISDGDIFFRLIEELLKRTGNHKIERVFATLGASARDVAEVLRQLGFQPYAQQSVWMLAKPAIEAGSSIVALRRQAKRDAWAIQQLYTSVTPRHVYHAEMRDDSDSWQLSRRGQWLMGRERAWVLGDDQSLTVRIHVRSGTRGHVIQMMLAPHLRNEAAAMVRYVLSQLHEERPIFVILRSYQSELGAALAELGFTERGEQTIYVKQLAIMKHQPVFLPGLLRPEQADGAVSISTITHQ
jgi:hypothetical protein